MLEQGKAKRGGRKVEGGREGGRERERELCHQRLEIEVDWSTQVFGLCLPCIQEYIIIGARQGEIRAVFFRSCSNRSSVGLNRFRCQPGYNGLFLFGLSLALCMFRAHAQSQKVEDSSDVRMYTSLFNQEEDEVPDDETLNQMIARNEDEFELFMVRNIKSYVLFHQNVCFCPHISHL